MTSLRQLSPARALAAALAASLLLLAFAAGSASAYSKPAGGRWRFFNLFDDTKKGALVLSRNASKVSKLVLVPGDTAETCGKGAIRLKSRPKIRSYRSVNGRYAVGKIRRGLFVQIPAVFKQGKRTRRGKLMMLWGETGRMVDTGKVDIGACSIDFYAHKR